MQDDTLNVYLLEDKPSHATKVCELLSRIVPEGCRQIRIALTEAGRPAARNASFTGAFTAPLRVSEQQYKWTNGNKIDSGWQFTQVTATAPLYVVPWEPSRDSNYFMPHVVILDIYTPGGTRIDTQATEHNYETTIGLFKGCGYPSDLVWTLSQKAGENKDYGHFFPKPFLGELAARRGDLELNLKTILQKHLRHASQNSYLEEDVATLYNEVLMDRSWRNDINIETDCNDATSLKEMWSSEAKSATYLWKIVDQPDSSSEKKRVFTFFTQRIGLAEQARYATGQWYGLPADYLWATAKVRNRNVPIYRQPEEVLRNAAEKFTDPRVNLVLKRNLFVLMRMIIGQQTTFKYLNHALPDLGRGLSPATINKMEDVFEMKTPDAWYHDRFLGELSESATIR